MHPLFYGEKDDASATRHASENRVERGEWEGKDAETTGRLRNTILPRERDNTDIGDNGVAKFTLWKYFFVYF